MSDAMQYGFHVGQRLASRNVKTAVNLSSMVTGINKAVRGVTGAADTASTAKPVVAAATSRVPSTTAPTGGAGGVTGADLIPWGKDHSQAMTNYTAAATKANPNVQPFGQPLKVAPPAGSAPAVRPTPAPPAPPAAPVRPATAAAPVTRPAAPPPAPFRAPQAVGTDAQRAQMFFDNAESGGRQKMLGYGQRGAPSILPQKWDQLSPEQQATVAQNFGN